MMILFFSKKAVNIFICEQRFCYSKVGKEIAEKRTEDLMS